MGFFLFLFLLFLRLTPFIPVAEVKELAHELREEEP
jgi:molybdopterin-containing oxidoreductase family membrane subunit